MKKFVLKSLPYLGIILAYGALGEYFLFKNKESFTIDYISEAQANAEKEQYFGREILGNSLSNYKFKRFLKTQPKVLVLGQSVTLQFRDFMFAPYHNDFYNTGLMARNATDLNYVLYLIEEDSVRKPELVLLGVDMSFFLEPTMLDDFEWTRNYPEDRASSMKSHLKGMQRIFLNRAFMSIPEIDEGYGRAGMQGRGYRNDGSHRHKAEIDKFLQDSTYYDGTLINRLKNREAPFVPPFSFSAAKAKTFYQVLERFKANNIELILYIPPYSDVYFKAAVKDPLFYNFWQEYIKVQDTLMAAGYNVIPFATPSALGLTDDYMVDAEHPGEVMCALQLKMAVQSPEVSGRMLNSLTFEYIDELMEGPYKLPLSFMKDSLSVLAAEKTIAERERKRKKLD